MSETTTEDFEPIDPDAEPDTVTQEDAGKEADGRTTRRFRRMRRTRRLNRARF